MKKCRGVSTFIAVLLLVALAVTAGILIYAYTMGYLGNFGGAEPKGSMTLDSAIIEENIELTAYIRNNGKSSLNFDSVYINGIKRDFLIQINDVPTKGPFNEGQVAVLYYFGEFIIGQTYEIKVITKEGVQLIFSLKPK